MNLPLLFARRYLFARKSHNVINVISAISAVGMAVGTAALILILSVYNGFDRIIESNISDLDPDLRVQLSEGKFFDPSPVLDLLAEARIRTCGGNSGTGSSDIGNSGTGSASPEGIRSEGTAAVILEDNIFLSYGDEQTIVRSRGVSDNYVSSSVLAKHLRSGSAALRKGDVPLACVGAGVAGRLSLSPRFVEGMHLFYPDRNTPVSLANPAASLHKATVYPGSTFSISSDIDNSLIIVPVDIMRELLDEDGASAVEIRLADSRPRHIEQCRRLLSQQLGPGYVVLNRYQMHPSLFRMMKMEKAAIFLILLFVVVIVAFNIFGSLSMLIIEKSNDMSMIRAMGGSNSLVRNIFRLEGWLISLLGLAAGLMLGTGLTLLQQHFGIVRLPGNFLIEAYPVDLQAVDVLLTAAGVALIGFLISLFAARGCSSD